MIVLPCSCYLGTTLVNLSAYYLEKLVTEVSSKINFCSIFSSKLIRKAKNIPLFFHSWRQFKLEFWIWPMSPYKLGIIGSNSHPEKVRNVFKTIAKMPFTNLHNSKKFYKKFNELGESGIFISQQWQTQYRNIKYILKYIDDFTFNNSIADFMVKYTHQFRLQKLLKLKVFGASIDFVRQLFS